MCCLKLEPCTVRTAIVQGSTAKVFTDALPPFLTGASWTVAVLTEEVAAKVCVTYREGEAL